MFYKIENELFSVEISDMGAELHSFKEKSSKTEFLWQGNPDIWYGQAPVLFPIIGRLLDDVYRFGGNEYSLPKHGFARKKVFSPVFVEGARAVFSLRSDYATLSVFPFPFELLVSFELCGSTLRSSNTVINTGTGEMYFSVGAHPGFNCSLGDYLEFEQLETVGTERVDENAMNLTEALPLLENENKIVITADIFNADALILHGLKSKSVTLKSPKHSRELLFTFGDAPFLGIWAKPAAPYVCIEPWYGVNDSYDKKDDISQKRGIERLNAGERFTQNWEVTVK